MDNQIIYIFSRVWTEPQMIMVRWEESDNLLRRLKQRQQMAIHKYWAIHTKTMKCSGQDWKSTPVRVGLTGRKRKNCGM